MRNLSFKTYRCELFIAVLALYCVVYAIFERIPFTLYDGITYQQLGLLLVTLTGLLFLRKNCVININLVCLPIFFYTLYVMQSIVGSIIFSGPKILLASLVINFIFAVTCYVALINLELDKAIRVVALTCLALIPFEFILQLLQIYLPDAIPMNLLPGGRFIDDYFRPPGFFRDPNFLGLFAAISFGAIYIYKNKAYIALLVMPCLILTGSYTAMGALTISSIAISIITGNRKILKNLFYTILLAIFLLLTLDEFRGYFIQKLDVITLNPVYNIRSLYLLLGYKMGIDSPIFGHGYGNYDWGIAAYLPDWVMKMRYYKHNFIETQKGFISHVLYATVFAENGMLGLVAVLGFIISPISRLIKSYKNKPNDSKLFLMNGCIVFAISTLSYGFRLSNGFYLLIIMLCIAYPYWENHVNKH